MKIEIEELYKIEEKDRERAFQTLSEAFVKYPKLLRAFPDPVKRRIAIDMVLRFYGGTMPEIET